MKVKPLLAFLALGVLFVGSLSSAQVLEDIDADPFVRTAAIYLEHIGTSFRFICPIIIYSSGKPAMDEMIHLFGEGSSRGSSESVWPCANFLKLEEPDFNDLIAEASPFFDRPERQTPSGYYGDFRVVICTTSETLLKDGIYAGDIIVRKMTKDSAMSFLVFLEEFATTSKSEDLAKEARRLINDLNRGWEKR